MEREGKGEWEGGESKKEIESKRRRTERLRE